MKSKVLDLVRSDPTLESRNAICLRLTGGNKSVKLGAIDELIEEGRLVQPGGDGSPFRVNA